MKNPSIKIQKTELLSDNHYVLNKITFDYQKKDDSWISHKREVYDRGNGAAILLYNLKLKTILLTRQFRLPTYLNGNKSGMMIEVCAGLLDQDSPEQCIIRETEEETGYRITKVEKIMETYSSPGAVTEILHLFIGEYDETMKVTEGGGLESEQENIDVIEMLFDDAYQKISSGEINDSKTVILLQYGKINLDL